MAILLAVGLCLGSRLSSTLAAWPSGSAPAPPPGRTRALAAARETASNRRPHADREVLRRSSAIARRDYPGLKRGQAALARPASQPVCSSSGSTALRRLRQGDHGHQSGAPGPFGTVTTIARTKVLRLPCSSFSRAMDWPRHCFQGAITAGVLGSSRRCSNAVTLAVTFVSITSAGVDRPLRRVAALFLAGWRPRAGSAISPALATNPWIPPEAHRFCPAPRMAPTMSAVGPHVWRQRGPPASRATAVPVSNHGRPPFTGRAGHGRPRGWYHSSPCPACLARLHSPSTPVLATIIPSDPSSRTVCLLLPIQ